MAQVTLPYTLTAGTPENVNNLMSNLTALRDGVNTIDTAQIADGAVTSAKLASGVGTVADGSITAAKINATVAGYLGLTSGATTRRWTVSAATERTTTALVGSPTDVTSASVSVDDVLGNLVLITATFELKSSNASGTAYGHVTADVPGGSSGAALGSYVAGTIGGNTAEPAVAGTTYKQQELWGGYVVPTTRTTTIKARFYTSNATYTAYIKNVVINVWAITP